MRDVMDQHQISIAVFSETINRYEREIRENIRGTKRIFYGTLFPGSEELKTSLLQHADAHVMMMEALPDFDDIPIDEEVYEAVVFFERPFLPTVIWWVGPSPLKLELEIRGLKQPLSTSKVCRQFCRKKPSTLN
jgi:hypothetical protein